MRLRTPLARVHGPGSAKGGTRHWWAQRLTAIALVPLSFWFIYSLAGMNMMDHADVTGWIQSPVISTLLILFIYLIFYHAQLGMQVVIEDYVAHEALMIGSIIAVKIVLWSAGLAAFLAVVKIFLRI
jgi:succinate dehydrogenase / fumarate reductase, membrane anchor subunit